MFFKGLYKDFHQILFEKVREGGEGKWNYNG
jgi:hypothetical protein